MNYQAGDKVIPLRKNVAGYGTLEDCSYWKKALKLKKGYLIVKEYFNLIENGQTVVLLREEEGYGGNYYKEEDLIPYREMSYEEFEDIIFEKLVSGKLTKEEYEYMKKVNKLIRGQE